MLTITLHDLRSRARQFLIAVLGAGLVFAMALLLAGLAHGFQVEVDRSVAALGTPSWVMGAGAPGRLTSLPLLPAADFPELGAEGTGAGPGRAAPVVIVPQTAATGSGLESIVLFGVVPGRLGSPVVVAGRPLTGPGQAVVDVRSGLPLGAGLAVSGHRFKVVGRVSGDSLLGGMPDVYVGLADAQAVALGSRPLINAVLLTSPPAHLPASLQVMTSQEVEAASLGQMSTAVQSIGNSRLFMWVIATLIVAALVYVTALERTRDFAVLKALGASSAALFRGLAVQAVLVSLLAAGIASAAANFMTGLFAQPVVIPASALVVLPVSALVVGLLASLVALRRSISVDPALALAGA